MNVVAWIGLASGMVTILAGVIVTIRSVTRAIWSGVHYLERLEQRVTTVERRQEGFERRLNVIQGQRGR